MNSVTCISVKKLKELLPFTIRFFNTNLFYDKYYWVADRKLFEKIMYKVVSEHIPYIKDRFDCDDFSRWFKCIATKDYGINCIGRVINPIMRHSYNVAIILNNGKFEFVTVEPQLGQYANYKTVFSLIEW